MDRKQNLFTSYFLVKGTKRILVISTTYQEFF